MSQLKKFRRGEEVSFAASGEQQMLGDQLLLLLASGEVEIFDGALSSATATVAGSSAPAEI